MLSSIIVYFVIAISGPSPTQEDAATCYALAPKTLLASEAYCVFENKEGMKWVVSVDGSAYTL